MTGDAAADPALRQSMDAASLAVLRLPRAGDTLADLFRDRAARFADRPFLLYRDRTRTWRETAACMGAWAAHLRTRAQPGDRVAVILPNCDSMVVLLLACAEAGLVFVPVNPALTAPELAAALSVAMPRLVIATQALQPLLPQAMAGTPAAEGRPEPILLDGDSLDLPPLAEPALPGAGPADPAAPLAIVFTSGTTGVPKGAVHANRTYVTAAEIATWRMRLCTEDRVLVILPLFHLNALFYSVGGAILSGARLVVESRFSAATFWQVVARHGITQVNMIAAVGNILLKRDRAEFPGNDTLRKVSAAPVTREVADALAAAFGIRHVVESYGMTEAPGIAQVDFFDREHRACLGRPIRHPLSGEPVSEIHIVDEDGARLPVGAEGRIQFRARTLMQGYFNRPDLRDRILPGGWFLTEDRGRMDGEGYVYFCGRTADRIRVRGENVSAAEVEGVLLTHPLVSEAVCIGLPSDLGEEDILAAVVPQPGASLAKADLMMAELAAHCRRQLSRHKVPRYFLLRDELPKTPTQKVAHHRLRAEPGLLDRAVEVGPPGERADG